MGIFAFERPLRCQRGMLRAKDIAGSRGRVAKTEAASLTLRHPPAAGVRPGGGVGGGWRFPRRTPRRLYGYMVSRPHIGSICSTDHVPQRKLGLSARQAVVDSR